MMARCISVLLIGSIFCAFGVEEEPEWKALEKQVIQKRGELKKLRNRNPSHIWGDEKQPVFLKKRMLNPGEAKYYVKQVSVVRPYCVCEHAALQDGGTKAKHPKRHSKRSLDRNSSDRNCSESELCPAWKQWRDAGIKVEETIAMNKEIDPVADELAELEKKLKEHLEERARQRKEELEKKRAMKNAKIDGKVSKGKKEDK